MLRHEEMAGAVLERGKNFDQPSYNVTRASAFPIADSCFDRAPLETMTRPVVPQSFEVDNMIAEDVENQLRYVTRESRSGPLLMRGRRIATNALVQCERKWHLLLYGCLLSFLVPLLTFRSDASLNDLAGNLGLVYAMLVVLCPPEVASRHTRLGMLFLYPLAWLLCGPLRNRNFSEHGALGFASTK